MRDVFGKYFQDFITALKDQKVDFVLIRGYAVIIRGYHRTTGYLDILLESLKIIIGESSRRLVTLVCQLLI